MTGSMWIRPYVLLAEEMQIQASILTPCWIIGQQTIAERNVEQTKDVLCTLKNLF